MKPRRFKNFQDAVALQVKTSRIRSKLRPHAAWVSFFASSFVRGRKEKHVNDYDLNEIWAKNEKEKKILINFWLLLSFQKSLIFSYKKNFPAAKIFRDEFFSWFRTYICQIKKWCWCVISEVPFQSNNIYSRYKLIQASYCFCYIHI